MNAALLAWYRGNGRNLVFRASNDPWSVLVSEVMLQQTQAARVGATWRCFMERFPTPMAMASAPVADVLRAWSGLGYNRRALWLHRTARVIVQRHAGRVPRDVADLEALPGVGRYTARAVAAIAFDRPVAAVDTNVRRVVARLVRPQGADARPAPAVELQAIANGLVDRRRPAEWTHAVMDLGAVLCRPRAPACDRCPIGRWCGYRASAIMSDRRSGPLRDHLLPGQPPRDGPAAAVPFRDTDRWLRGRIIERLRQVPPSGWTSVEGALGVHSPERVAAAITALERDGLLERRSDGAVRLPSTPPWPATEHLSAVT